MKIFTNKIILSIDLSISSNQEYKVTSINSVRFPWLCEENYICEIDDIFKKYIIIKKNKCYFKEMYNLKKEISEYIKGIFLTLGVIYSHKLIFEICINIYARDNEIALGFNSDDSVRFIQFEEYLKLNEKYISNITIEGDILYSQDYKKRSLNLVINSNEEIRLDQIEIYNNNNKINSRNYTVILYPNKKNIVEVPLIPLIEYMNLESDLSAFKFIFYSGTTFKEIYLSNDGITVCTDLRKTENNLNTLDLFLDLGSINSKIFIVENENFKYPRQLRTIDELKNEFNISYHKDEIISMGTDSLKNFLLTLIESFSSYFLKQKNLHLRNLYYAIPNYYDHNGKSILLDDFNKTINYNINYYLFGNVGIISESDCLKWKFESVFEEIRSVAFKDNKERDSMQREFMRLRKEYDDKFFIFKLFYSKPTDETPSLDNWVKEMVYSGVNPDTKDIVCLDAGGLSLDYYININNKSDSESFKAGGQLLTEILYKEMKKKSDKVTVNDAEIKKMYFCGGGANADNEIVKVMKNSTNEIYKPCLEKILSNIKEFKPQNGLLLITSGKAFDNVFLQELLINVIEKNKIGTYRMYSPHICELINKESRLNRQNNCKNFISISSGFGTLKPNSAYDIVGGMFNFFFKQ